MLGGDLLLTIEKHNTNVTLKRVRSSTVAVEKAISITHYECVFVAISIQQTTRMHWFCSHLLPVWLYYEFPHYIKMERFWKKFIGHKVCVSIFSTTFLWNISHSKKKSARFYSILFYSDSIETLIFSTSFQKNSNVKFRENPCCGRRVFHAGRQTWWS
jgi:hypothetical protein